MRGRRRQAGTDRPVKHRPSVPYRVPIVLVIAGLVVAGVVVDGRVHPKHPTETAAVTAQVPLAAPASARSSAWYCAGSTASTGGSADGSIVVANMGGRRLAGTVTVYPDKGEPRRTAVDVGAGARAAVRLGDVAPAAYAAAVVELDGGDAVVELALSGPLGDSVTPCASSASSSWYFAEGVTTRDASMMLLALNPFPDDAVVDVVFSTEEGVVTPQALTGLSVRGQGLTVINAGDFVQRRDAVTARVVARAGRLAVGRLQTFDGSAGRKGVSVALGAAAPGPVWYFPEGLVADGQNERYQVFNPGRSEAQVQVDFALDRGSAEPLTLTVPRESRVTVNASDEGRIPKGVAHSATIRATNGAGVVAERTIDGAAPSPRTGVSITVGSRLPARRWATAAGGADDTTDQWVVVLNPGPDPARLTVAVLADATGKAPDTVGVIDVPAGQRRSVHVNDAIKRPIAPVSVTSDQPVIVERDLYRVKGLGLAMGGAVPLR